MRKPWRLFNARTHLGAQMVQFSVKYQLSASGGTRLIVKVSSISSGDTQCFITVHNLDKTHNKLATTMGVATKPRKFSGRAFDD